MVLWRILVLLRLFFEESWFWSMTKVVDVIVIRLQFGGVPCFANYKSTFFLQKKARLKKWGSTYIRYSTYNREFRENRRKDYGEHADSYQTDDARLINSMHVCLSRQKS